jgi:hypothetical protein
MQWSSTRKSLILLVCSLYSFLSNSALLGPAVYIGIYAQEFGITSNEASNLVSYANLAFGFGGFFFSLFSTFCFSFFCFLFLFFPFFSFSFVFYFFISFISFFLVQMREHGVDRSHRIAPPGARVSQVWPPADHVGVACCGRSFP